MSEVRENETTLRKLSGGTAQLHTLVGTLPLTLKSSDPCCHERAEWGRPN